MDPLARKHTVDFYGYIPDGGSRTVIFGCTILNSSLLLLIRSFSAAMLLLAKKRYFVAHMAGDMALYSLQKVLRGDFHYWLPIDGAIGLFASFVARVLVKTVTDFTGLIQFRHPGELGGIYWTVNMLLALLASFVCVWVGGGGATEWTLFMSTDDSVKFNVIERNKKQWVEIREDVKEWVRANWSRWDEEKPAFFTESWIAKVPLDFIPKEAKATERDPCQGSSSEQLIAGSGEGGRHEQGSAGVN